VRKIGVVWVFGFIREMSLAESVKSLSLSFNCLGCIRKKADHPFKTARK